mmetsp:Transcript_13491/g.32015  ORF Transcript_13491/g.32015 Transcript_13491/m.32015 type:complete len:212 (-) Transcript_13491:813-1448(-)
MQRRSFLTTSTLGIPAGSRQRARRSVCPASCRAALMRLHHWCPWTAWRSIFWMRWSGAWPGRPPSASRGSAGRRRRARCRAPPAEASSSWAAAPVPASRWCAKTAASRPWVAAVAAAPLAGCPRGKVHGRQLTTRQLEAARGVACSSSSRPMSLGSPGRRITGFLGGLAAAMDVAPARPVTLSVRTHRCGSPVAPRWMTTGRWTMQRDLRS